jgi:intraflagellar transport protein 22
MSITLSIFVLGPPKAGKSTISNFLADFSESLGSVEYQPTQGVRILEFQRKLFGKGKKWKEVLVDGILDSQVQLWDCGGDTRFQETWPAFSNSIHGCLLVAEADEKDEKTLDSFQALFPFLNPNQLCIFAHKTNSSNQKPRFKPSNFH